MDQGCSRRQQFTCRSGRRGRGHARRACPRFRRGGPGWNTRASNTVGRAVGNSLQQPWDKSHSDTPTPPSKLMGMLRILIADDHAVVRRGVRAILESQPGWEVCGEVANGREAVEEVKHLKPDVVVLDVTMPELN